MEQVMENEAGVSAPRFEQVRFERPAPKIGRIVLNRPEKKNAQSLQMLYELNDAFDLATQDNEISVIILAAEGSDFSSGHDLSGTESKRISDFRPVSTWGQFRAKGLEGYYSREKEIYLELTERWRNIPKPVIAEVQGRVIAGGLMLVWVADLIVASDDAMFLDNTPEMGINGTEFFNHPYELGIRKAKEWLFMTEWLSAEEAKQLGMVNRVVRRSELQSETLNIGIRVAEKPLFTLKAIKESINNAQDLMGRPANNKFTFALHHLLHSHARQLTGFPVLANQLTPKIQEHIRVQTERMRQNK